MFKKVYDLTLQKDDIKLVMNGVVKEGIHKLEEDTNHSKENEPYQLLLLGPDLLLTGRVPSLTTELRGPSGRLLIHLEGQERLVL